MSIRLRSLVAPLVLVLLFIGPAWPDEFSDFRASVKDAAYRAATAVGYLESGNRDAATLEIEDLRIAWNVATARFTKPPPGFGGEPQSYGSALLNVKTNLVVASMMINSGHGEVARQALIDIGKELSALLKAAGTTY
jgi:hypothetical protein